MLGRLPCSHLHILPRVCVLKAHLRYRCTFGRVHLQGTSRRCLASDAVPTQATAQASEGQGTTRDPTRLGKRKVAIFLGYEGTGYRGLQIQPHTAPDATIESNLEKAIYQIGGILPTNLGNLTRLGWSRSSRTDKLVHSLTTVISMKMECEPDKFETDPYGLGIAEAINAHLPSSVRIFSVQRVTKSFDARADCLRRTYNYYLPLTLLTTDGVGSQEQAIQLLKEAWGKFEGHNAFHNYTKRSLYRGNSKPSGTAFRATTQADSQAARDSSDDRELQQRSMSSTSTSSGHDDTSDYSSSDGEWYRNMVIEWKGERDEADVVGKRHFRYIEECNIDEEPRALVPGGEPCIKLTVKGASFMLHQIRHMVGAAVTVARGKAPLSLIDTSLCPPARLSFPLAPAPSLVLAAAEFSPFRLSFNGQESVATRLTGDRLALQGSGLDARHRFEAQRLFPALDGMLHGEQWGEWQETVDRAVYDKDRCDELEGLVEAWNAKKTARREAREQAIAENKREEEAVDVGGEALAT